MAFEINRTNDGHADVVELKNIQTEESVVIVPDMGGTVNQITLKDFGGLRELLKVDEKHYTDNHSYRGRLLFPFNDRIPEAFYEWFGKEYQLKSNCASDGSAIHGLIYDQKMTVVNESADENSAQMTLSFEILPDQFEGYPFQVFFQVQYLLTEEGFKMNFKIENTGKDVAPVALGWHPYFKIGDNLMDHNLYMNSNSYVAVDRDLIPTGDIPSVDDTELDFRRGGSLEEVELDHALTAPMDQETVLKYEDRSVVIQQDTKFFEYVQCYIPRNRQSIAIEPVSAATDSFNREELGRTDLIPGEIINTWCSVSVS